MRLLDDLLPRAYLTEEQEFNMIAALHSLRYRAPGFPFGECLAALRIARLIDDPEAWLAAVYDDVAI